MPNHTSPQTIRLPRNLKIALTKCMQAHNKSASVVVGDALRMYLPCIGFEIPSDACGFIDITDSSLIIQRIDKKGSLMAISKGWLAAFGYERGEVIGRYLGDFLTEASAAEMKNNIKKPVSQRPDLFMRTFVCKDKSELLAEVTLSRELNTNNELESSTAIITLK